MRFRAETADRRAFRFFGADVGAIIRLATGEVDDGAGNVLYGLGNYYWEKKEPDFYYTRFEINPTFWINAIPNHLYFEIGAGFIFDKNKKGKDGELFIGWNITPLLAWNFLASGATDDPSTGMIIKYEMGKKPFDTKLNKSQLTATFKWSI